MRLTARESILLALGTLVTGVAMAAQPLPTKHALQLASVTTAYAQGDTVGAIQSGPDCAASAPREWSTLLQHRVETELSRAFQDEVAKATPAAIKRAVAHGDLNINAILNDLKVQVCDLGKGAWRGGFQVQVSWQLKRRDATQPSFQSTTTGVFDSSRIEQAGPAGPGLRAAFATSVRQLLANPQFIAALAAPEAPGTMIADASPQR
jgi:hypothetical protein